MCRSCRSSWPLGNSISPLQETPVLNFSSLMFLLKSLCLFVSCVSFFLSGYLVNTIRKCIQYRNIGTKRGIDAVNLTTWVMVFGSGLWEECGRAEERPRRQAMLYEAVLVGVWRQDCREKHRQSQPGPRGSSRNRTLLDTGLRLITTTFWPKEKTWLTSADTVSAWVRLN